MLKFTGYKEEKVKKIDMLVNEDQVEIKEQTRLCEVDKEYSNQLFLLKEGVHEPVLSLIQ